MDPKKDPPPQGLFRKNVGAFWGWGVLLAFTPWEPGFLTICQAPDGLCYKGWQTRRPWAKCNLQLIFVSKDLLTHSHTHSFTYHPWLCLQYSNRTYLPSGPWHNKFADPCSINVKSTKNADLTSPWRNMDLLSDNRCQFKYYQGNIL